MFYQKEQFLFYEQLEQNWEIIKEEFLNLKRTMYVDWPEKHFYEGNWKVFGLFDWPGGKKLDSAKYCPKTVSIIEEFIPQHMSAGFSILKPKTKIKPHTGRPIDVLRCHLGLIIPKDCGLQVNGETQKWENGKVFVFDDTYLHSAWNDSEEERVILLLDFKKPKI
jgi:beta-hydroxylase